VTFVPATSPAPADAEVEKYYTANAKEFETSHQAKAQHMLARVGETAAVRRRTGPGPRSSTSSSAVKAGEDSTSSRAS